MKNENIADTMHLSGDDKAQINFAWTYHLVTRGHNYSYMQKSTTLILHFNGLASTRSK